MDIGRYVSIFALPSGDFTYAIDGRANGPMSHEAAWSEIDAKPVILFYAMEQVAHLPKAAPSVVESPGPSAARNYHPHP